MYSESGDNQSKNSFVESVLFFDPKKKILLHLFVRGGGMCMSWCVRVCVCRSENNFHELISLSTSWVLGIKLRSLDLIASTLSL